MYGYIQGLVLTGLWILSHEAGHGQLSPNQTLNDLVGWTTHSFLLVPYFSWKFSHARHHRFVGHMEKDTVFVPNSSESSSESRAVALGIDFLEEYDDIPIAQLIRLFLHQIFGWPLYLFFNISAGKHSIQRPLKNWLRQSHFDLGSAVFHEREALGIILSDIGLLLMVAVLYYCCLVVGVGEVMLIYGVPWLWVHHWLGMLIFYGLGMYAEMTHSSFLISIDHLSSTHSPRCSSFYTQRLDLYKGCDCDSGQGFRLVRTTSLSRGH